MLDEELKWAGELQKTLLETEEPRTRKLSFQTTYSPLPNLHCGGDYYDIIRFGEEQFILLIGDVAGHGVKAAFITSILKTIIYRNYIRIRVGKSFSPANFLTWLNKQLRREHEKFPDMIVTFLTIFVDVNHRSMVYSNAGHLPFYKFNREGKGEWHTESGSAMGLYPDMPYRDNALPLNEGDTVVCITDGLTEHPRSTEPMGYNIIEDIILREAKTNSFHSNVMKAVKSQLKTEELYDDTTLISFRVEEI